MLVFLVHAILEGHVGLMGLLGSMTGLYDGSAVLFQVSPQEPSPEAVTLVVRMAYSVLLTFGGAAYLLLFMAKRKHFEVLIPMAFGYSFHVTAFAVPSTQSNSTYNNSDSATIYHFLLASSVLTRLFDPAKPDLPFPARSFVLGQLAPLHVIPVIKYISEILAAISDEELRLICAALGTVLHASMGISFVRWIVDASDEWRAQIEEADEKEKKEAMWSSKKSSASFGTGSEPSTPSSPPKTRFKNKISTLIDVFGSRKRLTEDGSDGELNEPPPPLPTSLLQLKTGVDQLRPMSPDYDTPIVTKAPTARESVLHVLATEETNLRQKIKVVLAGIEDSKDTGLDKEALQLVMADLQHLTNSNTVDSEDVALAERILGFYIKPNFEECLSLWFGKSKATDDDIWARFGETVARASNNEMDSWALNVNRPRMLVALLILLDQFRRNMYRDTADMYTRDHHCVKLVKRAIRAEVPAVLQPIEGVFLCLVLTHTENIQDQMLCLELWTQFSKQLRLQDPLNVFDEIFKRHVAVIQRFGRFPHRNEILGRVSSSEELEFLQDNTFRFDMPLKKDPETGLLLFVPAKRNRRVSVLGFEYTTLLPDKEELDVEYDAAIQFLGPHGIVMKAKEQLTKQGYVRLGDTAPDFTCQTSNGLLKFHDYIGDGWVVLFSHPADFTPICTTEFGETAKLKAEWEKRNTKVIGLSVDGLEDHERWIADINEVCSTTVDFPIIADKDRRISMLFGMLDSTTFRHGDRQGETMTVRSVFIISPKKRVELVFSYPAHIGRNFKEIIRTLDALQLSFKYRVATPVNWMPGDDTVVLPFITDDEADKLFDGDVRKELSYLRWVRDPSTRVLVKEN
ncbi:hypothetical protein HDU80_007602 [Chytriomyces hyalinus]|nr:hypothetical protein HDU80_007602 [Chytriomyces hyalinus]